MKQSTILKDIVELLEKAANDFGFTNVEHVEVNTRKYKLADTIFPNNFLHYTGVIEVLNNRIDMVWVVPDTGFVVTTRINPAAFQDCKNKNEIRANLYRELAYYFTYFEYPNFERDNRVIAGVPEDSFALKKDKIVQAVEFLSNFGKSLK